MVCEESVHRKQDSHFCHALRNARLYISALAVVPTFFEKRDISRWTPDLLACTRVTSKKRKNMRGNLQTRSWLQKISISCATLAIVTIAGAAAKTSIRSRDAQAPPAQPNSTGTSWQFAVSGDSRNCGDVVMPAIAADALKHQPNFYWHLGDFRAIYTFDEDILHQPQFLEHPPTIYSYEDFAWRDFIEHQLVPFGKLPIFLGIGNHETIAPKTREEWITQFADWLGAPALRDQRLKDDPRDHLLHTYNHWREHNIDFISMDNASADQFDDAQLAWFERVLSRDLADPDVATIVVGMHRALPDSISADHSMNESAQGTQSGRQVYQDLLKAQAKGKHIYLLASHSHFYMANTFNTEYVRTHGGVLPGWIIGTAGAVRYSLPPESKNAAAAETNVYGYLLASVRADGLIDFDFHKLEERDIPTAVVERYKSAFVHWCFAKNSAAQEP